jgi:hypothetical protein
MAKKISIVEAKRERFDMLVDEKAGILSKILVEIEEYGQKDGLRRANKIENSGNVDYSQVFNEALGVVEDISVRFKYSYDGEYWRREWEIGGVGFTYKPVRHWVVLMEDEETKEAHILCVEYFRVLYEFKSSDLYRWILSKLEEIDIEYSEKKRAVGVYFEIQYSKGTNYKCTLGKSSESALLVEVVGSSKIFEIDRGEKRENKEVVVEIIGRVLEEEIKKEVRSRVK